MHDLIKEYRKSLRNVEHIKDHAPDEDKTILGSMESDLRLAMEWMKTGRRPGNRRGIERRAAYQREKPMDPMLMQNYFDSKYGNTYNLVGAVSIGAVEMRDIPKINTISRHDLEKVEDALSDLTEREKEIYLMSRGHCLSYTEISIYLNVTKSTVQDTIERAEKKISKRTSESLFCFME